MVFWIIIELVLLVASTIVSRLLATAPKASSLVLSNRRLQKKAA